MLSTDSLKLLRGYLTQTGISFEETQMEQLGYYAESLRENNRYFNLTRIVGDRQFAIKHVVDSLSIVHLLQSHNADSFIDIGTGAGFPGLVLKIFQPQLKATLVDSVSKKVQFLKGVIGHLGLKDCEAVWGRAEDLAHRKEYREQFSVGLGRAVAELRVLAEILLPFVRVNGILIAQKGPILEQELADASRAIRELGGEVELVKMFELPEGTGKRSVVALRKVLPSPPKYPRKAGIPEKRPL